MHVRVVEGLLFLNHCLSQEDAGPTYIYNNGAQVGRDASSAGAGYRLTG